MIEYKQGDLLESGCDVICHQCNCRGSMASGVAKSIRDKWPESYETLRHTYLNGKACLGRCDFVRIMDGDKVAVDVVNMYSQYDYYPRTICHTNYEAFQACLNKIKEHYTLSKGIIRIGFPDHIGCGLAGGDWEIVKKMIENTFEGLEWHIEIWKLS